MKVKSCQKLLRILDDFLPSQFWGVGPSKNSANFITPASQHLDCKSFLRMLPLTRKLLGRQERQFRTGLCFTRDVSFFLFYFRHWLSRAPSTDRAETLPNGRNLAEFYNHITKPRRALPPKIGGQKHAKFPSILDYFRIWSRISPERLKISKIGKRYKPWQFLLRLTKKVQWTLVK